jgi:hypothetical protein
MNVQSDPTTKMGFNWFTNSTCGKVEIVLGNTTNPNDFSTPLKTVNAICNLINNTRENKAVVTGLTPNTTYSFRFDSNAINYIPLPQIIKTISI